MKKAMAVVFAISLLFAFAGSGACREKENLYSMLSDAKEVRTYVADVTDSSGQAKDMLKGIKEQLINALETRMTINFVLVPDEKADPDLIITCNVIERIWMDHDPVDQIGGTASIAMDIAKDDDYGRLQAVFRVKRGPGKAISRRISRAFRRKNILWERKLQATITKSDMSEEASKPLLEERIAEVFMRKCFSKNARM